MSQFARFFGIAIAGTLAAAPAIAAPPVTAKSVHATLGALSGADLEVTGPRVRALFGQMFTNPKNNCTDLDSPHNFLSGYCAWLETAQESDAFDFDLMIGIDGNRVASVITSGTLSPANWNCAKLYPGRKESELNICNIRTADAAAQKRWTAGWQAFLDAAG